MIVRAKMLEGAPARDVLREAVLEARLIVQAD